MRLGPRVWPDSSGKIPKQERFQVRDDCVCRQSGSSGAQQPWRLREAGVSRRRKTKHASSQQSAGVTDRHARTLQSHTQPKNLKHLKQNHERYLSKRERWRGRPKKQQAHFTSHRFFLKRLSGRGGEQAADLGEVRAGPSTAAWCGLRRHRIWGGAELATLHEPSWRGTVRVPRFPLTLVGLSPWW